MSINGDLTELVLNALVMAQAGATVEARQTLMTIRREWDVEESPHVIVDLMTIEGICWCYEGSLPASHDRLLRATAIAQTLGDSGRLHLAAGWMAFVQFSSGAIQNSMETLLLSSRHVRGASPQRRIRAAMLIAILHEFCGNKKSGADWFAFVRGIASIAKLVGCASSLIYNMAILRINSNLYKRFDVDSRYTDVDLDVLFAQSSSNFDLYTGVEIQSSFHSLVRAQGLSLQGDYEKALVAVNEFLARSESVPSQFIAQGKFERAFYQHKIGMVNEDGVLETLEGLLSCLPADDDLAIANQVLSMIAESAGLREQGEHFRQRAIRHRARHVDLCVWIQRQLHEASLITVSDDWIMEV
jgi:hypothetical protein